MHSTPLLPTKGDHSDAEQYLVSGGSEGGQDDEEDQQAKAGLSSLWHSNTLFHRETYKEKKSNGNLQNKV